MEVVLKTQACLEKWVRIPGMLVHVTYDENYVGFMIRKYKVTCFA